MSTLAPSVTAPSNSVVRHAAVYRAALPRQPALAAYPDVATLAATLAPRSPFDNESRAEVLLALVEAICLRRSTERRVFDHMRDVRGLAVTEEFDDDAHATFTLADIVDEGGARRLDEALDTLEDPALKELIVSTCIEEVPLGTYVERLYSTLSRPKQVATAETLRRQRSNALAAMARRGRKKRPLVEEVA
jgi:hypothetical protein